MIDRRVLEILNRLYYYCGIIEKEDPRIEELLDELWDEQPDFEPKEKSSKDALTLEPCPCCGSTRIHVVAPDDGCYCWDYGLTMPNRPNWRERWNRRE